MYDRTIRRRRAVLALLVAGSLILITASFGSPSSGPIGSIQRGIGTIISPVQEGASRALKPVRDLIGWIGESIHATGDLSDARRDRDMWEARAVASEADARRGRELQALFGLRDTPTTIDSYGPVTGRVIVRSTSLWNSQVMIDRGSSDGIAVDMPVVAADTGGGAGLVGKVSTVTSGSAVVTLLTSSAMTVGARSLDGKTVGDLRRRGGDPQDLVLDSAVLGPQAGAGTVIVTAGTVSSRADLRSLYPPDIPIGRITRIDDPGSPTELAHVRPFVRLRDIEFVQVLTRPPKGATR